MVALLALLGCHTLPPGDPQRPDVVLISIDSVRADHLSSYGYKRNTTPNLDALAAKGARYTHAMSGSPWTLPAHMTMMTGLWPTEHQVIEDDRRLSDSVPTIAERMKAAGYATAGFVSAVYLGGGYGFDRGFDRYEDYGLSEKASFAHQVRTPALVGDALKWAKKLPDGKPAFLFLHTYDAHYPYNPPAPWNTMYNRALRPLDLGYKNWTYYKLHPIGKNRMKALISQYDESIRYVDDSLGPLIDTWSHDRNVVFIVLADHGEEFGERGSWGHAHTLYSEVLDVPLIVSGSGVPAGVRTERVGNVDVAATIAAIGGATWGIGDGVDVRATVADRPFWPETSRFDANVLGVVDGPADHASALVVDLAKGKREHYNLWSDPGEAHPEAVANDPLEARIYQHLGEPWRAAAGAITSTAALFQAGARVPTVSAPATFGMWPPDGTLSVDVEGVVTTIAGSIGVPSDGPVSSAGSQPAEGRALNAEVKAELQSLGYTEDPATPGAGDGKEDQADPADEPPKN